MTCKNCNAPLEEQARFCVKCGAPVADSQPRISQVIPQDVTKIAPQPKRIDNPIRPPKRPVPVQPKQEGGEQKIGEAWPAPILKIDTEKIDTGNQPVVASGAPIDAAHEQPAITLTPDTRDASTPEERDGLYGQPTTVVKRNNIHQPPYNAPTLPFEMPRVSHPELVEMEEPERVEIERALSSSEEPQPLLYYQLNTAAKGSQKLPAVVNRTGYNRRPRRGCLGCILSGLSTVIVLLLIIGALWVFALRPYAHNIAQRELDNALTSAVNQLPAQATQLPAGSVIPVNENTINNLIVLNLAPSNPVQHPTTSINGQNIRLDFQLYNFPCAITMVPTLDNGRLVVNKVGVEGIFSAIMSPEEMTAILNKHLNDAQSKLQRTINNVQLKDHEVDLTLG